MPCKFKYGKTELIACIVVREGQLVTSRLLTVELEIFNVDKLPEFDKFIAVIMDPEISKVVRYVLLTCSEVFKKANGSNR